LNAQTTPPHPLRAGGRRRLTLTTLLVSIALLTAIAAGAAGVAAGYDADEPVIVAIPGDPTPPPDPTLAGPDEIAPTEDPLGPDPTAEPEDGPGEIADAPEGEPTEEPNPEPDPIDPNEAPDQIADQEPAPPATVQVSVSDCSDVVGPAKAYELSLAELEAAGCPLQPGAEFSLESGGQIVDVLATDADGAAAWWDLDAATVTLTGFSPGYEYGVPMVFCRVDAADYAPIALDVSGGATVFALTHDLAAGTTYACRWFNTAGYGAGVDLIKAVCPEGTDPSLPIDALIALCQGDGAGWEFTLMAEGGIELPNGTVKHMNSNVGFTGWAAVPPGKTAIYEHLEAGWADPVVFCALTPAGSDPGPFLPQPISDAAFGVNLEAGDRLSCWWFNVPAGEGDDLPQDQGDEPSDDQPSDDGDGDGDGHTSGDATPDGGTGVVIQLPDTGAGAATAGPRSGSKPVQAVGALLLLLAVGGGTRLVSRSTR
jgi:hypothetical protein